MLTGYKHLQYFGVSLLPSANWITSHALTSKRIYPGRVPCSLCAILGDTEEEEVTVKELGQDWNLGDFPGGAVVKNPPANAGDMGSSPGPGRSHMLRSN